RRLQMNLFKDLENPEHSFAAWAEKELEKIEGEAPTIEKVAASVLTYVGPALQTVVTAEAGGAGGAIVGKVISTAQGALTAAGSLIYDFGAVPSVASIFGSVKSNLSALLTAGDVTGAKSVATVNKVMNEISLVASAIAPAVAVVKAAA
ncbi:MAG: hypothetical protein ABSA33_07155, partial [Candidatus Micrarchaeaceae archaeon]